VSETYDIADVCTFYEKTACKVFLFFLHFDAPAINDALVVRNLLL
jgi:hypothetical protein